MRRLHWITLLFLLAWPFAANALPQRTFVASTGSDANPCSLTAPCRTFGAAVAAVADGGEVVVVDSAGYGAVTIGKSVAILAPPGVYAGVTVAGIAGVTVNAVGIQVVLRGLTINNRGSTDGILFAQGASLHVENCVVSGMNAGVGIVISAAGSVTHVLDTIVRDSQKGILITGSATGNISRTRVEHNVSQGIQVLDNAVVSIEDSVVTGGDRSIDVSPSAPGTTSYVTVARTLIEGGGYDIVASPGPLAVAQVTVMDSTVSNAGVAGVITQPASGVAIVTVARSQLQGNVTALLADGAAARLILDGNTVTSNGTGINRLNGGTIVTRGNNTVHSNGTDAASQPYTSLGGI